MDFKTWIISESTDLDRLAKTLKTDLRKQAVADVANVNDKYRQSYLADFDANVNVEPHPADGWFQKKPLLLILITSDRFDQTQYTGITGWQGVEVMSRVTS